MSRSGPTVLPVKLGRPVSSPLVVPRPRLFKQVDAFRRHARVVWLAGPPGAGKTTLASGYLAARRLRHLWYQVDAGDHDPGTFFHYLGLGARQAASRSRTPLPAFTPQRHVSVAVFGRRYFEALTARLRPPFVLVLDNYHEVAADSALHEALAEGCAALPDGVQLFVLSRAEPPAAFARLRANDGLALIQPRELALTFEESRAITLKRMRKSADAIRVRRLHEQTQGWAAGLVLLIEHAATGGEWPVTSGAESQALFDYFTTEIIRKLPAPTRDTLLRTSLLPEVSEAAAVELTGWAGAPAVLAELHRQNVFTVKRSDRAVYQYHPLLRESLLRQARTAFAPEQLEDLQRRSAARLEQEGRMEDAADLWLQLGDWAALGGLVLEHAAMLVRQGRLQRLAGWLGAIPAEWADRSPWLHYWLGVCRLPYDLRRARADFERAFAGFEGNGDRDGLLLAWCGIVESFVYEWGDFSPLDRWIAAVDVHLARGPLPEGDVGERVTNGMFCALFYRQPQHPDLPLWEERAREIALHGIDTALRVMVCHQLVLYYRLTGQITKAMNLVELLRPVAEAPGVAPLTSTAWYATAGFALWTADDKNQCRAVVEQGLRVAEASGVHFFDFMLFGHYAWVGLNDNDLDLSHRNLERMRALSRPERSLEVAHYHHLAHIDARYRGEKARAAEHAAGALACAEASGSPLFVASALIGTARVAADEGDGEHAHAHLTAVCAIARAAGSIGHEYSAHKAIAELGLDDAGLTSLRRCMELGARHEYVSGMWWHPRTMGRLCATALRHGIEPAYVRGIIRKRAIPPPADIADVEAWPWPVKIYTLGRFTVMLDDAPLRFAGKAQRRPLDLLMALVSLGGSNVGETRLAEAVWSDAEADAAHVAFTAALARLRRLLRSDDALVLSQNQLSLDPERVWVDAVAFERGLTAGGRNADAMTRALDLYHGAFLDGAGGPWALTPRERLRARFLGAIDALSEHLMRQHEFARAIDLLERGLAADPVGEELYRRLMRCQVALGRRAEALSVYRRCERVLSAELGIPPGPKTRSLFDTLRESTTPSS